MIIGSASTSKGGRGRNFRASTRQAIPTFARDYANFVGGADGYGQVYLTNSIVGNLALTDGNLAGIGGGWR